jgi:hypothetical protein
MLPIALALTTATALVATSSPSTSRQEIAMSSNTATARRPHDREAADTADREAIRAAVLAIATGADRRDWDAVRAAFAPSVLLDYGTPERLTPAEIVGRWQPLLGGLRTPRSIQLRGARDPRHGATEPGRRQTLPATHVLAGRRGPEGDGPGRSRGATSTTSARDARRALARDADAHDPGREPPGTPSCSPAGAGARRLARARPGRVRRRRRPPRGARRARGLRVGRRAMVGNLYCPADVRGPAPRCRPPS